MSQDPSKREAPGRNLDESRIAFRRRIICGGRPRRTGAVRTGRARQKLPAARWFVRRFLAGEHRCGLSSDGHCGYTERGRLRTGRRACERSPQSSARQRSRVPSLVSRTRMRAGRRSSGRIFIKNAVFSMSTRSAVGEASWAPGWNIARRHAFRCAARRNRSEDDAECGPGPSNGARLGRRGRRCRSSSSSCLSRS